jgi:hypothetical protein
LEVASVKKNKEELIIVLEDMADHLPKEDPSKGTLVKMSTMTTSTHEGIHEKSRQPTHH